MSDPKRGLYHKFDVERVDRSPKHQNCRYYVLDLTHDKHAPPALEAYADSCEREYPLLARDLRKLALGMRDRFSGDAGSAPFQHCVKCFTLEDCKERGACLTGGKMPATAAPTKAQPCAKTSTDIAVAALISRARNWEMTLAAYDGADMPASDAWEAFQIIHALAAMARTK